MTVLFIDKIKFKDKKKFKESFKNQYSTYHEIYDIPNKPKPYEKYIIFEREHNEEYDMFIKEG